MKKIYLYPETEVFIAETRKALMAGSTQNYGSPGDSFAKDNDFGWDDNDSEDSPEVALSATAVADTTWGEWE